MKRMPKSKEPGRALVRQYKQKNRDPRVSFIPSETTDWCRLPVKSITQETSLDDFFHTANLSNTDFTAQKMEIKVLSHAEVIGVRTLDERWRQDRLIDENAKSLCILKRPKLNKMMTAKEVADAEQEAYLKWRRELSRLEHIDGIVLTPYERNLDFWRQLWQVIEKSDVLVQVVDARQPLLFFSAGLNDYIREVDVSKKTLILVNKSDLLTSEQRIAWGKYFRSVGIGAIFFSALEATVKIQESNKDIDQPEQASRIDNTVEEEELEGNGFKNKEPIDKDEVPENSSVADMCEHFYDLLATSDTDSDHSTLCDPDEDNLAEEKGTVDDIDVDKEIPCSNYFAQTCRILSVAELIDVLAKSRARSPDREYLTVGFLGYPNVGKSSTLNALCGEKKVPVSATPGRTKHHQTIFLQSDLCLCDCPGMVMPSFVHGREDLVVAGILSIDEMHDCIPPVRLICEQIPREVFSSVYGVRLPKPLEHEDQCRPPSPYELLGCYALLRSFMTASGNPHYDRAARIILKDYVKGRLRFCHPPPGVEGTTYRNLGVSHDETLSEDTACLSAYVSPKEVQKLEKVVKMNRNADVCHKKADRPLTSFDMIAFNEFQDTRPGRLERSNKKLPIPAESAGGLDDGNDDDSASILSSSSWSTVSSLHSVGGASLLSGMSRTSTVLTGKKPWRQLSAIKHQQQNIAGSQKKAKKREKLRRVYAIHDKHEVL